MLRPRHSILTMVLALAPTVVTSARPGLPFDASLDTQPTILGPCGPGCLALDIPGSGIASHLGAITVGGPSRIDLVNGTQTATATFTAANGDTLVLDIAGTVQFSGPDPADPVTFTGSWTVQSGSGRFRNASGSGSYSGSAAGPSGELTMSGSLSNIGSR